MSAPVIPDYGGPNLCGLMPGLVLGSPGSRPDWFPEPLRNATRVVLLLVDGLGWHQLSERWALAPTLRSMQGDPITTVAPSTTASALTSLTTGSSPIEHGIVGYRMDMGRGEIMNSLRWHNGQTDVRTRFRPSEVQPVPPFAGSRVPVVSRAELEATAFTEAHLRGTSPEGWRTSSGIVSRISRLVAAGERFVYAYYDGIDKIAHEHGFGDFYDNELRFTDDLVSAILRSLPTVTTLCVTADHGQVQVDDRVIVLDPTITPLITHQSGEGRFRWLHCAPTLEAELLTRCRDLYGDVAWIVSREQVLDENWLGPRRNGRPDAVNRLGQVALVPREPVSFHDPLDSGPFELVCRHGSLTEHEMRVPLLAHTV